MMPGYTTLPLRAGDDAFCPTLKADSSRSVYLRAGVAPRVGSVEPEPADSEKAEEEERPEHEPCHPLDKVWLPTYPDDNTQDALHTWCTDTGTVRNQGGEVARPRGFWVTLLYRLQRRIEKESRKTGMTAQLTEPQAKLILTSWMRWKATTTTGGAPSRRRSLNSCAWFRNGDLTLQSNWLLTP